MADLVRFIQRGDRLGQSLGAGSGERLLGVEGELAAQLVVGQRVVRAAAGGHDPLFVGHAVVHRDAQDGRELARKQAVALGVDEGLDFGGQAQQSRVAGAVVGEVVEVDPEAAPAHESRGDGERAAELRVIAAARAELLLARLADRPQRSGRPAQLDADNPLGVDAVLSSDRQGGVDAGVGVVVGWIRLEEDAGELPVLAQAVDDRRGVGLLVQEGAVQAEAPFQDSRRAGVAVPGEGGGHQPGVGGPAAMQALDGPARAVRLDHAAAHAGRDAQGMPDPLGAESEQLGAGGGRAERPADRGRVPAVLEPDVAHIRQVAGHADPDRQLDADRGGVDRLGAGAATRFGQRQRGRHDAGAGMEDRGQVRVVEVQAVGKRPVDQRALRRRVAARAADDAGLLAPTPPADQLGHAVAESLGVGRHADTERVQDAQLDAVPDLGRDAFARCLGGEARKLDRERLGAHGKATASGRTGEPVAPTNFKGRQTKRNS